VTALLLPAVMAASVAAVLRFRDHWPAWRAVLYGAAFGLAWLLVEVAMIAF
jgi:hypothetical protein